MKIRTGFVSNSSSSSFIIYGTTIKENSSVYNRLVEKINKECDEPVQDTNDLVEELWNSNFTVFYGETPEMFYIGKHPWNDLGPSETKTEFINRVEKELEEFLGEAVSCKYISKVICS